MGPQTASRKVLVTGGSGFLGEALVRRLLAHGDDVRTLQRSSCPELRALGAVTHRGDLRDYEAVLEAAAGCDVVFHTAARVGVWGPYLEFYHSNVDGTQNVIRACRELDVRRLVYTSSPSVVFDGGDGHGIDESAKYPRRFLSNYPKTKAMAEQLVLAANDDRLSTVALRPHLIWGPGDRHLVPRLVGRARSGHLRLVGSGANLVDITYIDNAVEAHVRAAERLSPGAACAGRAYFVSDGDPRPFREILDRILGAAGLPPVRRSISPHVAYAAAAALEFVHTCLRIKEEPVITRFVVRELATSHWFDLTAARRDLGYVPAVSFAQGIQRLADWLGGSPAKVI